MGMRIGWFRAWTGAACVLALAACSTTQEPEASPAGGERAEVETPAAATPSAAASPPAGRLASAALEPVYFDYDRWDLGADARRILQENARKIEARGGEATLVVEGHCDERGSEEYNLALGARRAAEVARYLRNLGISEPRVRTVSFGEARPAATGHGEISWRMNRRSELRLESHQASR